MVLYPLAAFFTVSLVANLATFDWAESVLMVSLLSFTAAIIILYEYYDGVRNRKIAAELNTLRGLDKCPISRQELCELFEFLDRPDPPPCNHRLSEACQFLKVRGLEVEQTLKWLNANGAGCDCEVIYNTAQRYGADVGFNPEVSDVG